MFYNVENLFDTYNDTLKNDEEFLPGGLRRWNFMRYNKKINSLYKTIIAAGEWDPPAIISFYEVENRKVLEDLIYGTYLSKFNYRIIHEESPDLRGIDVCMIYRKDLVNFVSYKYWIPSDVKKEDFASRSVLYAKFNINQDTLHFFVNHWPSRRGGVLAGAKLRMNIATMVRNKVDSILIRSNDRGKIIIAGDFNCTPEDNEIKLLTSRDGGMDLLNLSEESFIEGSRIVQV